MKNVTIALAPIKYHEKSEKDNVMKIKKYVNEAGRKKADIICFPESCLHKSIKFDLSDKRIREICVECKKNSIWCIITDDILIKKKTYNAALLINRQGKIIGHYKKIHLYDDNVHPGTKAKVFKTDFGKIGIAICWDLSFSELFKKLREKGAEIVFCPSQWCYEEKAYDKEHKKKETEILRSLVKTRAFENIYFVAMCNPITKDKDLVSYSAIASPHKILKESISSEKLIIQKINLDEIQKFKKIYKDYK